MQGEFRSGCPPAHSWRHEKPHHLSTSGDGHRGTASQVERNNWQAGTTSPWSAVRTHHPVRTCRKRVRKNSQSHPRNAREKIMSDTVPVLAQIPPASLSWMDHVRQMEADAESRRQERIAERAGEEARRDERRHPRRNRREISAENGQAVISAGRMVASDLPIQGELDDITEEVETAWRKLVASKSLARTTALAMEIQRLMVQASDVMRRHAAAINNTLARQYDLSANNGKVSPENNRPYAGLAGLGEIVDADTPSRVLQPKHERRGEKTIRNWARAH